MMSAPVNPIDDRERRAPQLVVEPAGDEAADHGFAVVLALKRPGRRRPRRTSFRQALVQPLDDIAAFPKRTQALLRISGQNPTRGTGRLSKPQPLEVTHPTNPDLP